MLLFTDAFVRNIDDKHRIQIPAEFRNSMDAERDGHSFYVVPGERDNTLSLYPEQYFRKRVDAMRTDEIPGSEALDFEQMFFSLASRVEMDKQGRLVLPERQLTMVNLGTEVFITGAGYRLDVWRKTDYEQFLAEVLGRRSTLQSFLRKGSTPPGAVGG